MSNEAGSGVYFPQEHFGELKVLVEQAKAHQIAWYEVYSFVNQYMPSDAESAVQFWFQGAEIVNRGGLRVPDNFIDLIYPLETAKINAGGYFTASFYSQLKALGFDITAEKFIEATDAIAESVLSRLVDQNGEIPFVKTILDEDAALGAEILGIPDHLFAATLASYFALETDIFFEGPNALPDNDLERAEHIAVGALTGALMLIGYPFAWLLDNLMSEDAPRVRRMYKSESGERIVEYLSGEIIRYSKDGIVQDRAPREGENSVLGSLCFGKGTPVLMADGTERAIENICVGDMVMAFDGFKELVPCRVSQIHRNTSPEMIRLKNGVLVTPNHPFLSENGNFISVEKLIDEGAKGVAHNGELKELTGHKLIEEGLPWDTFNLTVEGLHTYVAGGWRVHNTSVGKFVEEGSTIEGFVLGPDGEQILLTTMADGTKRKLTATPNDDNTDTVRLLDERYYNSGSEDVIGVSKTLNFSNGEPDGDPEYDFDFSGEIISGEQIGSIFGSAFGRGLAGDDVFAQVIIGSVAETFFQQIGEAVHLDIRGVSLDGPKGQPSSFSELHGAANDDVLEDFVGNLQGAAIGAVSSYLASELIGALGVDGVKGEILQTTFSTAGTTIIGNLGNLGQYAIVDGVRTPIEWNSNLKGSIGNALGSYLGSKVASEVISPRDFGEGLAGSIGGAVGGYVGGAVGTALLGPVGGYIGSAIGSFVGQVSYTLIARSPYLAYAIAGPAGLALHGLFKLINGWHTPRSAADVSWNPHTGQFYISDSWSQKGGNEEGAKLLAGQVAGFLNDTLALTGASLLNGGDIQTGTYGTRNDYFTYRDEPSTAKGKSDIDRKFKGDNAVEDLISYGAWQAFNDMQLVGGNVYAKRAFYSTLELSNGGINFDPMAILGNLSTAWDYQSYIQQTQLIQTMMSFEPNSAFTAGWIVTLQRAYELGLHKRHEADWNGGWNFYADDLGASVGSMELNYQAGWNGQAGARVISYVDSDGQVIGLQDTIDQAGKDRIHLTDGDDIFDMTTRAATATVGIVDVVDDVRGYTINGQKMDTAAVAGEDFTAASGSVTIAAGETSAQFTVQVTADSIEEGLESFFVELSRSNPAFVGENFDPETMGSIGYQVNNLQQFNGLQNITFKDRSGEAYIQDGVEGPLSLSSSRIAEDSGYATFTLSLDETVTETTLKLDLNGGRARAGGVDFGTSDGSGLEVSFDGGATWSIVAVHEITEIVEGQAEPVVTGSEILLTVPVGSGDVLLRTPITLDPELQEIADMSALRSLLESGAILGVQGVNLDGLDGLVSATDLAARFDAAGQDMEEALGSFDSYVLKSVERGDTLTANYVDMTALRALVADSSDVTVQELDLSDFGDLAELWQVEVSFSVLDLDLKDFLGAQAASVLLAVVSGPEGDESFSLSAEIIGGNADWIGESATGVMTIVEDGGAVGELDPNAHISVSNTYVHEDSGYAQFRIELTHAQDSAVTLALDLVGDGADGEGVDFGAADGTGMEVSFDDGLTWQQVESVQNEDGILVPTITLIAGSEEAIIRTVIVDDVEDTDEESGELVLEAEETFYLTAEVVSDGGMAGKRAGGTATILADGADPVMWIEDIIVDEATGEATFTVRVSRAAEGELTTWYETGDRKELQIDVAAEVHGGDGNDIINGGDLGNDLFGDAGDDIITGGSKDDWIFGGDGNDTLNAGGGNGNYLDGGAGDDIINGAGGSDWLEGGAGSDILKGGKGGDILSGGSDRLNEDGTTDGDQLFGGSGDDQYIFRLGDGEDVVVDKAEGQAGRLDLNAHYAAMAAGIVLRNFEGGGDYVENAGTSSAGALGGTDVLALGAGITMSMIELAIVGDDLVLRLLDKDGDLTGDVLTMTDWTDATNRIEILRFADGQELRLGAFENFITGTGGDDYIMGSNFNDFVVGGKGDDTIALLLGDDFGAGGLGDDLITGGGANDIVVGGAGDDILFGDAQRDLLDGGAGSDQLWGGSGDDRIVGAKGDDTLIGGTGDDTFHVARGDGHDTVYDGLGNGYTNIWTRSGGLAEDVTLAANGALTLADGTVVYDGNQWQGLVEHNIDFIRVHEGTATSDWGQDRIEFAIGIDIGEIYLQWQDNDLVVGIGSPAGEVSSFDSLTDTITLVNWEHTQAIEEFLFFNTGVLNTDEIDVWGGETDAEGMINGSVGKDWLTGLGDDDTIVGGLGDDILVGHGGNDTLIGGDGADALLGGGNDDILEGGLGADNLVGGSGLDIISYANSTSAVEVHLDTGLAAGGHASGDVFSQIEGITGSDHGDTLFGSDGENVLSGGAGNDILAGGKGSDEYVWNLGDGNDTILDAGLKYQNPNPSNGGSNGNARGGGGSNNPNRRRWFDEESEDAYYDEMDDAVYDSFDTTATLANATSDLANYKVNGNEAGENDTLSLGEGIGLRDLSFAMTGDDLEITVHGDNGGTITIQNFAISQNTIETLALIDGTEINLGDYRDDMIAKTVTVLADTEITLQSDNTALHIDGSIIQLEIGTAISFGEAATAATITEIDAGALASTVDGALVVLAVGQEITYAGGETGTIQAVDLSDAEDSILSVGVMKAGGEIIELAIGDEIQAGGVSLWIENDARNLTDLGTTVALADGTVQLLLSDTLVTLTTAVSHDNYDDFLAGSAVTNSLSGLAGDDSLSGYDGDDVLDGGDGNDQLSGGAGADELIGGAGNDTALYTGSDAAVEVDLEAGAGIGGDAEGDTLTEIENLRGSEFNDKLYGDASDNILSGSFGDDILKGAKGDDILIGGDGIDTLEGGEGDDELDGGAGGDKLYGEEGNDTLYGGAGVDTLEGGADNDALYGGSGGDTLKGEAGEDTLVGDAGNDKLYGGSDNDTLVGGVGDDTLKGGKGNDLYVFSVDSGHDTIVDGDGINNLVFSVPQEQLWFSSDNGDLLIEVVGGDASVRIEGYFEADFDRDAIRIQSGNYLLYTKFIDPLVDEMAGSDKPETVDDLPETITALLPTYWHADGNASPQDKVIELTEGQNGVLEFYLDIVDHDENIVSYTLGGDVFTRVGESNEYDGPDGSTLTDLGGGKYVFDGSPTFYGETSLTVTVTDALGNVSQADVTLNITYNNDAPTDIYLDDDDALENMGDVMVGTLITTDANVIDGQTQTHTYKIVDGNDGTKFEIKDDKLWLIEAGDFEAEGSLTVTIEVTDGGELSFTRDIIVNLLDVNEAPTAINVDGETAPENTLDVEIGTVIALDPDTGIGNDFADHVFSVNNPDFEIVDGVLRLAEGITLDYEETPEIDLEITVTDRNGEGESFTQALTITVEDKIDVINGTDLKDILTGAAGEDWIYAEADDDVIHAQAGDDLAYGGSGADLIYGGEGNDRLHGEAGDDRLEGGAGDDALHGGSDNDILLGQAGADALSGGDGNDDLDGGEGSDTLYAGVGHDVLRGGAGDDALYGESGDDLLHGDAGADSLDGGTGVDTVSYETSAAAVTVDLLSGTGAGGQAEGDSLSDIETVKGSAFGDTLTGSALNDTLYGGAGADALSGGDGDDALYGEAGSDNLTGGVGADVLVGGLGNDTLTGGADNDDLYGEEGDDLLQGGAGNDALYGGAGNDELWGNGGSDVYVIGKDGGDDTIWNTDSTGAKDVVRYVDNITYQQLWFERTGDDLLVTVIAEGSSITIKNWFVTPPGEEPENYYKVDLFIAGEWVSREVHVDTMIELMDDYARPTSEAELAVALTGMSEALADLWDLNTAPVIDAIENQTTKEDTALPVTITVTDAETAISHIEIQVGSNDILVLNPEDVTIGEPDADGNRELTFLPVEDAFGDATITVTAIDGNGAESAQSFDFTVTPVNDAPELSAISELTMKEDGTQTLALTLSDVDTSLDNITLSIESDNTGLVDADSFVWAGTGEERTLHITPLSNANGTATVTITADDGEATTEHSFDLVVNAVNDAPGITGDTTATIKEDSGWSEVALTIADVETDMSDLTVSVSTSNGSVIPAEQLEIVISYNSDTGTTHLLRFKPDTNAWGTSDLVVSVTDDGEGEDTSALISTHKVRVTVDSVNDKPTIAEISDIALDEDAASTTINFTIGDVESAASDITLSVTSSDEDLIASDDIQFGGSGTDRNISFTPIGDAFGDVIIIVTATDGGGETYSEKFIVSVASDNDLPTIEAISDVSVTEGKDGKLNIAASDVEDAGNDLDISAISSDTSVINNLSVSSADELSYTAVGVGSADITVTVTDSDGGETDETFTITSTAAASAPEFGQSSYASAIIETARRGFPVTSVSTETELDLTATDVNGGTLTYEITSGDTDGMFYIADVYSNDGDDSNDGVFLYGNGTLDYETLASYELGITVTDEGGLYDTTTVNVAVGNENEPLFIESTGFALHVSDPEKSAELYNFKILKVTKLLGNEEIDPSYLGAELSEVSADGSFTITLTNFEESVPLLHDIDIEITDSDGLTAVYENLRLRVQGVPLTRRPVILDLDGDGIEMVSLDSSTVYFDMDGDGMRERTGWVGADDGLLALDRNGDGKINDMSEISFVDDLPGAETDLEGLRAFDSNGNGMLDAGDDRFGDFIVWQDKNQNGHSEQSEMVSLLEAGITSISLDISQTGDVIDATTTDNVMTGTSAFTWASGATGIAGDIAFFYDDNDGRGPKEAKPLKSVHSQPAQDDDGDNIPLWIENELEDMLEEIAPPGSDSLIGYELSAESIMAAISASGNEALFVEAMTAHLMDKAGVTSISIEAESDIDDVNFEEPWLEEGEFNKNNSAQSQQFDVAVVNPGLVQQLMASTLNDNGAFEADLYGSDDDKPKTARFFANSGDSTFM